MIFPYHYLETSDNLRGDLSPGEFLSLLTHVNREEDDVAARFLLAVKSQYLNWRSPYPDFLPGDLSYSYEAWCPLVVAMIATRQPVFIADSGYDLSWSTLQVYRALTRFDLYGLYTSEGKPLVSGDLEGVADHLGLRPMDFLCGYRPYGYHIFEFEKEK